MITIVMDANKNLKLTATAPVYQFENNADTIMCLLPSVYGSFLLSECSAKLCFQNSFGKSGFIELAPQKYNNNYLNFSGTTNIDMTIAGGDLKLWIEVSNSMEKFSLTTSPTSLFITKLIDVSDKDAEKILPIFSQWTIQMNQIKNTASDTLQQAIEQANRATKAADIALEIAKELQGWVI